MSLYTTTFRDAQRTFHQNRFSRWYRKGASPDHPDGELAFQRLRQSLFTASVTPRFKMRREDKLFAIGSCFARGIEKALMRQKMEVLSAAPEFASLQPVNKEVTGLGFTNKYNSFSIYNELNWALDPASKFPRESIAEIDNGLFCDPHTNPTLQLAGLEETLQRRELIEMVTRRIAQCRVVIITLGLVETWRDNVADTFINSTPISELFRRYPNRYEFHVTSFSQNLANLENVHRLLSQFGHPDVQFVVTVSPVPLMATFSPEDVVVANTYSKSLLRAIAQEWVTAHPNVHYFPSYEIVQNSERSITWQDDLRHVQGEVVNHIMRIFLENYLD